MTRTDALDVWHAAAPGSARLVGELWRDDFNRIGFRYDDDWRRRGFAISI